METVEHDAVLLKDGRRVEVRPITPDDGDRLAAFHAKLSPESVRRRYFTAHPVLTPAELHHFTHVDGHTRLALVAVCEDEIVGVGRYESLPESDTVEVAFLIRDDFQGAGLGGSLVQCIGAEAAAHGKRLLVAETLPENQAMRRAMHHAGPVVNVFRDGIVEVTVPIGEDATGAAGDGPPP